MKAGRPRPPDATLTAGRFCDQRFDVAVVLVNDVGPFPSVCLFLQTYHWLFRGAVHALLAGFPLARAANPRLRHISVKSVACWTRLSASEKSSPSRRYEKMLQNGAEDAVFLSL